MVIKLTTEAVVALDKIVRKFRTEVEDAAKLSANERSSEVVPQDVKNAAVEIAKTCKFDG